MNAPPQLYALGLVALMEQQNVHHFEIDLKALDPEKSRGLSLNFTIEDEKITISTGRCDCTACVAAAAGTQ